jgi:glucose/arabinose dehydrogenase
MLPRVRKNLTKPPLSSRKFFPFLTGVALVSLLLAACVGANSSTTTPRTAPTAVEPTGTVETGSALQSASVAVPPSIPSTGDVVSFPTPAQYQWSPVASGLNQPIGMAVPGDGSGRLFVIQKQGQIVILQNNQVLAPVFLDISDRVGSGGSEQGLLGLAFDPKYSQNGRFYVDYTDLNGNTVISRFTLTKNANQADPGSEKILLQQQQPFPNHNGGQLAVGPDGYLYIGLGDGGSAGDPRGNGQSLNTFLGKVLRIDVSQGDSYKVPSDNPFKGANQRPEIWAYGLRNPWRFSFDMQTHDLYIGDVGQDAWEEIDFIPAGTPGGTNFGWSYREGLNPYKGNPPAGLNLTDPVFNYSHSLGCSVTGGFVYRGSALPEWQGIYLFGDYCSGRVWGMLRSGGIWHTQELFDTHFGISSFGQDEHGEVYLVDINGNVLRLAKK